jgi:hypothetical protein
MDVFCFQIGDDDREGSLARFAVDDDVVNNVNPIRHGRATARIQAYHCGTSMLPCNRVPTSSWSIFQMLCEHVLVALTVCAWRDLSNRI